LSYIWYRVAFIHRFKKKLRKKEKDDISYHYEFVVELLLIVIYIFVTVLENSITSIKKQRKNSKDKKWC